MIPAREGEKLNVPLFLMMILLAGNMRAGYTGVGTIIGMIKGDLGMSNTVAGMITTVPLLVFSVVCPLSSRISRRFGLGRMMELSLALIAAGCALRALAGSFGLFLGTVVLSVGVGVMNALMVGLIKLRFPGHLGVVTSAYTTTMALTAAFSIGVSVPVASVIGWRGSLALWAVVSAVSVVLWAPQSRRPENFGSREPGRAGLMRRLLRAPKAWQLMTFMGTQSMMFYCVAAWMPTILQAKGFTVHQAAAAATVLQVVSLPTTLLVPILGEKFSRVKLAGIMDAFYLAGAVLFFFARSTGLIYTAIIVMALGIGSGFSFCILLFSKCSRTSAETAALSGFAQSGGYVLAAIGPVLMGGLYDRTGSWNGPMIYCFCILLVMTAASLLSTRKGYVLKEE